MLARDQVHAYVLVTNVVISIAIELPDRTSRCLHDLKLHVSCRLALAKCVRFV